MSQARVLIADGLPLFRAGVRRILEREADAVVVEVATTDELLEQVDERRPDVALIDLELPPHGGVAAVHELAERCDARTIVWSFQPDPEIVLAAVRGGACGYLDKELPPAALARALRGVLKGEAPIGRRLALQMIDALHRLESRSAARERASVLSAREREVLALLARGARTREIAAELTISEFTVKRHVQNILQKLRLPSRRAAAALYRSALAREAVPR